MSTGSNGMKSWIVHGPQGCGKTVNARRIADALGLRDVRDDWDGRHRSFRLTDTLHLTHELPEWTGQIRRVMGFERAMLLVDGKITLREVTA